MEQGEHANSCHDSAAGPTGWVTFFSLGSIGDLSKKGPLQTVVRFHFQVLFSIINNSNDDKRRTGTASYHGVPDVYLNCVQNCRNTSESQCCINDGILPSWSHFFSGFCSGEAEGVEGALAVVVSNCFIN